MPPEQRRIKPPPQPIPWLDKDPYNGAYVFGYFQKEVIRLAPDCVVFIDGKLSVPICNVCGRSKDIRNDIVSVSVSQSIDGHPGTATIEIAAPRHEEDKYFLNGELIFSDMQEVRIYMKGRYLVDGQPRYYPVFWGLISSPTDAYSPSSGTITLGCVSMLRWWEIMKVVIQPSAVDKEYSGLEITPWLTRFANKNPFQIMYALAQITMANVIAPNDLNKLNVITETKQDWKGSNSRLIDYWNTRFGELQNTLQIYGFGGNLVVLSEDRSSETSRKIDDDRLKAESMAFEIPNLPPEMKDLSHIGPFKGWYQGNNTEAEYKSNLEIANEVKDFIGYEFFQQMDGNLIFKPPFYNMDTRSNYPVSWIEDREVVSWGFSTSESEVATRVDVTGSLIDIQELGGPVQPRGYYQDYSLCRKYGIRAQEVSFKYLRDPLSCQIYALSELSRRNARTTASSVTIVGRPEIFLGFPVYVPARDAFYYVTGITHNFSFGGSFQTTLSLEAKRSKRYKVDSTGSPTKELLINGAMVFQGEKVNSSYPQGTTMTQAEKQREEVYKKYGLIASRQGHWEETSGVPLLEATDVSFPISDGEGYSLIGGFKYGRDRSIENGKIVDRKEVTTSEWFTQWIIQSTQGLETDSVLSQLEQPETPENTQQVDATFQQWQDALQQREAQDRTDIAATAGSAENTGKVLADLRPNDTALNPKCDCGGNFDFSTYLKSVLAGVSQPSSDDLVSQVISTAANTTGAYRQSSISKLNQELQKDQNFVSEAEQRLSNPTGVSTAQVVALKQDLASTRDRIRRVEKAITSFSGDILDQPLKPEELQALLE